MPHVITCRTLGPVELTLDVLNTERNPGRAPVNHAADRRPVAFAEAGEPEEVAESIE